jgi:hypothetical protein
MAFLSSRYSDKMHVVPDSHTPLPSILFTSVLDQIHSQNTSGFNHFSLLAQKPHWSQQLTCFTWSATIATAAINILFPHSAHVTLQHSEWLHYKHPKCTTRSSYTGFLAIPHTFLACFYPESWHMLYLLTGLSLSQDLHSSVLRIIQGSGGRLLLEEAFITPSNMTPIPPKHQKTYQDLPYYFLSVSKNRMLCEVRILMHSSLHLQHIPL